MMKITCFVLVVCLLAGTAAAAATTANYSFTAYVGPAGSQIGENWISVPGVPLDPTPDAVFGPAADDYHLWYLDAPTQNLLGWASYDPSFNVLLGDGFVMMVDDGQDHPFSYVGVANGVPDAGGNKTDMWISLPGQAGAAMSEHWIGCPYDDAVDFESILVTDGTQTIGVQDAISAGWLEGYWAYLDATTQNMFMVDPDWAMGEPYLYPWHMYKVKTFKQNIALIIPAPV